MVRPGVTGKPQQKLCGFGAVPMKCWSGAEWTAARLSSLRSSVERRHADFQSRVGSSRALYFKELPGVRCPNSITVHNDANYHPRHRNDGAGFGCPYNYC